jgi:hypothetical protein
MSPASRPATPGQRQKQKLPIGIQTFCEIREDGCYYVDKTGFALKLATQGKHYFLSRPRRFGKSLFLDTVAELFAATPTPTWTASSPLNCQA